MKLAREPIKGIRNCSLLEAAREIGVSPDTVRRLAVERGQIKHLRIGKRILIPRSEVERLCTAQ